MRPRPPLYPAPHTGVLHKEDSTFSRPLACLGDLHYTKLDHFSLDDSDHQTPPAGRGGYVKDVHAQFVENGMKKEEPGRLPR